MVDADIEAAVDLLASGFPERTPDYWRHGLLRLRNRSVPDNCPRYGQVLCDGDRLVGIILVLISRTDTGEIRGNVSSWYVEAAYRSFSHLLLSAPLKLKGVTLFNMSPAPTTLETIQTQGFVPYVGGSFRALAALAPPVRGARICRIEANAGAGILADHAALGCLSFEVTHKGETYPFVFRACRFVGNRVPCAQLIYCRDLSEFTRFAGPLGRRLLRHGLAAVLVDSNASLRGVPGLYRVGRGIKYYRGATPPRLGDLSYSEFVVFGP